MLKAPPLQTATATIDTLCGRLQSATLLEDRRNAIMGLRSFAKQFPASVASGSLRELITILRRDGLGQSSDVKSTDGQNYGNGGDVDTVRLILETLLMLFNPDAKSAEASDEVALFMADEFAMRQDNVALLLSLLDPTSPVADYYSRLYSIQLLSAICPARPDRLQECVLGAPLGISRLVGTLDDGRDAVRNAGLLLLVDLTTNASDDLKKLVAFEDVFGKVFALIQSEGGLGEAGIMAQDCLSLLANLIRSSSSNQTMFRESGCVTAMQALLQHAIPAGSSEAMFVAQNREKATWGLLQLLSLFFVQGSPGTVQNQVAFFRAGTAQTLVDMGFSSTLPLPIRVLALNNASALINANAPLQEAFATMAVNSSAAEEKVNGTHTNGDRSGTPSVGGQKKKSAEVPQTYVIEALLDLALKQVQEEADLREAANDLIEAYLQGHSRIKPHFLQRAIAGQAEHETAANVLLSLLDPPDDSLALSFASRIVSELIYESPEAKTELSNIQEGNESEGEDVLKSIQSLASHLQDALQDPTDERRFVAYSGLLAVLFWGFPEGINDFLAEGSGTLQVLIDTAGSETHSALSSGLSAMILGVVYEFSTKDSPIPRRTLATILTEKLGRDRYLKALGDLRRVPAIRDYEVVDVSDGPPLLSKSFIELFTVEYTRLRKAIDKDPRLEAVSTSTLESGVDRDVLDELRGQLGISREQMTQLQQSAAAAAEEHERHRMNADKETHSAKGEIERLRRINESIQQEHEKDHEKIIKEHEARIHNIGLEQVQKLNAARHEERRQAQTLFDQQSREHTEKVNDAERRLAELGNKHRAEQQAHATLRQQYDALSIKNTQIGAREASLAKELGDLTAKTAKLQREYQEAQGRATKSTSELSTLRQTVEGLESKVEQLSNQEQELKRELAARNAELAAERSGFATLEKELESAKTAVAELEQHKRDADESNDKLAALQTKLDDVKSKHSTTEQALETARTLATKLEQERDDLRKKLTSQEKESATAQTRIKALEKEATASKSTGGAEKSSIDKLRKDLKTRDEELKTERGKVTALSKEVSVAKQALTTAQAASKGSKGASKEEAAKIARLEKELGEARGAEKAAKEELDSMLLVMGDIESKRDEYRSRVKELGGDVSEEDGNEDEDEDDEDDGNDNDDVD